MAEIRSNGRNRGLDEAALARQRADWLFGINLTRRILASAKEWGEIPAMPDLPRLKVPESSWDFFTSGETERLLAACRDEEERALLMFASTPARGRESSWRSRGMLEAGSDVARRETSARLDD